MFTPVRVRVIGRIQFRFCSLGRFYGSLSLFRFAWVHPSALSGRRGHSGSSGFTRAGLVVVEFMRVRVSSLGCSRGSSYSFGFAWVHWGGLCADDVFVQYD